MKPEILALDMHPDIPLETLEQGSEAWLQARVGKLGASRLHEALAKTKTGWGATRANVMSDIIIERLTGKPVEQYVNGAMQRGKEMEPEARAAYEWRHDVEVEKVGLILHPTIQGTHASPDGYIGEDGLIEIKCPTTATHLDTLLTQQIPGKYVIQMQWQMACTGRQWCDYVSYDSRLPDEMRMFVKRVARDDKQIADLEKEVRIFLGELEEKLATLQKRYEFTPTNLALKKNMWDTL